VKDLKRTVRKLEEEIARMKSESAPAPSKKKSAGG
jgi:hypothetical protein